jgi:threonine aldolase
LKPDPVRVHASCDKYLSYDYPLTVKEKLLRIADHPASEIAQDDFGRGDLFELLEGRLAKVLGKEAAAFMPTGRMAQLIGLKLWCERRSNLKIAIHPRCHIEQSEAGGYHLAYGLQAVFIGEPTRITEPRDLLALGERVGAISLEIPHHTLGCLLPTWDELNEMSSIARERRTPLHFDAARLWESQPFYNKPHEQIANLADSLYVSMYKGLGALSGGVLAGPKELIAAARLAQFRLGGTPRLLAPYLVDGLRALESGLPLMQRFYEKSLSLSEAFVALRVVCITPSPPQTNTFLVAIPGNQQRLRDCAVEVSEETGLWLVDVERPTGVDGTAQFQVVVGEATLDVSNEEAVAALAKLVEKLA